jgi:hypothetical protein
VIDTDSSGYRSAIIALGIIAGVLLGGILIIGAMASAGEEKYGEIVADYAMLNSLGIAQGAIAKDLSGMDGAVTKGAVEIGQNGIEGGPALAILSGMSSSGPAAIDAVTADLNGKIVAIKPDQYHSVIGAGIYNQTHIKRLYEQKIPVMSDLFMTVEGYPAVDIASPVFSPDGKFIGSTTLLINPGTLIGRDMPIVTGPDPPEAWVVQTDGTLLFASDRQPAGRNIFNDPGLVKYPDLVHLLGNITTEWEGNTMVTITDMQGNQVTKHLVWTTVGIRGTEWRIVFGREVANRNGITGIFNETVS